MAGDCASTQIQGVAIMQVAPDSPAAEAGLQPGDVIFEVDRQPVTDVEWISIGFQQCQALPFYKKSIR
ncbi:PDZ domain-containing protein [uncultured Desulfosarcina sp.]|uniref:PDZ domain-containing protein n=1 Tax=uncultured Desulfosarcina sp. TaxID=218289 RepID=UPI0029C9110B|nr:PDZ domain-containing protein [uncultured Desulfosarcina sp.]